MENLMFYNLDIRELIDRVHIGPQAEVLELIENVNENYVNLYSHVKEYKMKPLGITKKFYWKPGAYDTIKTLILLRYDHFRKANSLVKVFERSENTWRIRDIKLKIAEIEKKLVYFRVQGMMMQDNSDDAQEAWQLLKNHLLNQLSEITGMSVRIDIENNEEDEYYLWIRYSKTDFTIDYRHHAGEHIQDIFCPGTVSINIKISISKLINAMITNKFVIENLPLVSNTYNGRKGFTVGGYWNNEFKLEHPYISNGLIYRNNEIDDLRYVCLGNLESEIHTCIKSLDLISLNVFVEKLITHYDTSTGPLNSITLTYHGHPNFIDDDSEYYEILGKSSIDRCRYGINIIDMPIRFVTEDSYCAKFCNAKDICSIYIENSKVLNPEEIERLAIEKATIQLARGGR